MKKTPLKFAFTGLLVATSILLHAQNIAINTTGAAASASAILDLSNTSSMAFLPPQVALTNVTVLAPVPAPGPAGLVVYSTTAPAGGGGVGLYLWTGAAWNYITVGVAGGSAWNLSGNAATNPLINYAGTSDPNPFIIKTNATERMRFLSGGGAGIGTATPLSGVDVNGSIGVGTYAGTVAAPANGIIVSGKVGIGNSAPNASAILDLTNAVNNLGFLLPNMTTAQRNAIGAPAKGLMVFNNTTGCINFWTGFAWENVACPSCTAAPATPGVITGTAPYVVSSTNNVFTIASVPGAVSYTWSLLPASAGYTITGGQGTTSATFTFGAAVATFTLCVHDSNACGTSATSCLTFTTTNCTHSSQTFNYTGNAVQTWTVPACITQVTVKLWGAGGASGYMPTQTDISGGSGAYMIGIITGLTGQTLTLYVPQGGLYSTGGVGGVGGWPGGGHGGNDANFTEYGGGGGGYAGISIGGTYYAVAGGGGAGGSSEYGGAAYGGGGGATTGGTAGTPSGTPATGGSVAAGGIAGSSANGCDFGNNGLAFTGGLGGGTTCSGWYGGGGGGAGYFGGGGGGDYGGGGGGGASYPAANILTVPGFTITSNLPGTTNTVDGTAVAPGSPIPITIGAGNYAAAGGNGQIIIIW